MVQTFYLIDFENVHNEGISNIDGLSKDDHVHIFSTQNALNIRQDIFWLKVDIKSHLVPVRKQSLDMHLVSYLGYLLGTYGKECTYIIVSKDKDYNNIIKFWKQEGYTNISRKTSIPSKTNIQSKVKTKEIISTPKTINSRISAGMAHNFSGKNRSELNVFMQHGLKELGYDSSTLNRVCKYVVAHCNDESMLKEIHNDLREEWYDYLEIYKDVKSIIEKFVTSKKETSQRELQVRSFFGQHFKKKIYIDCKEEIIDIVVNAKTRQQVNNQLLKLYTNGNVVKNIYSTLQPLIKDLPGK